MVTALAAARKVDVLGSIDTAVHKALHFASLGGRLEVVRLLLMQEGVDVNRKDFNGDSPLCVASCHGHEAVVEVLITAGADANTQNRWGNTALMGASLSGHTAIVRRLIEAGARVNQAMNGWTALDCACSHPDTLAVLLAHRAMPGARNMNLPALHERLLRLAHLTDAPFALSPEEALPEVLSETDEHGRTALHYAALTGARAAYTVLRSVMREAGVNMEGTDGGGYTALDHMVCVCMCVACHVSHLFTVLTPDPFPSPRVSHRGHAAAQSCACSQRLAKLALRCLVACSTQQ
jgi:ankyrin repeat protein